MFYTDNPVHDFWKHDQEQQERLKKLPKCYECGERIQDEHCYEINDEYICERCMNENHRKWVEDLIE